ncbi:MAG: hypothetical protein V1662_00265 [Candidatus Omnitrophota bacterium]
MLSFKHSPEKEKLGQVLIREEMITPEQLEYALQAQKQQGGLLGEILIQLGFTTEEDIAQALAIQHNFPYLPLANYDIDAEIIKLVPESTARKYCLLPVDKMGDILTIVMADPLDKKAIDEIEALTKCKSEIFVTTYTEIKQALERFYAGNKEQRTEGQE